MPFVGKSETYDWLRSNVNQFWFNQFVGNCKDNYISAAAAPHPGINTAMAHCSRISTSIQVNQAMGKDLMTNLYFDEALVEQAVQNQCEFNYWSALNTKNNVSYTTQAQANKKLGDQFSFLKSHLKTHSFNDQDQATKAQKKIVSQLVEAAVRIAESKRKLKHFQATHPIYTVDPKNSPKEQILKLSNELALLENSFVFAEDPKVASFVKYDIQNKLNDIYALGKTPNLDELKDFFYKDPQMNFQKRVVEEKLKSISAEQKNYSEINGNYNDAYSFKVATVQSGVGAKILNRKSNQNPHFAKVQCDLDSKYGKGEKMASTAHSVVVGGLTIFFGGASLTLARLAQLGMTSQRAAKVGQIISGAMNSTLSAGELTRSIVETCTQPDFQKKDGSICSRVQAVKKSGLELQLTAEIEHSDCLVDLGLASLSGAFVFRNVVATKKLNQNRQLLELGLRDRYGPLIAQIKNDSRLLPADRNQLIKELNRSISLSNLNGFPRKEFLDSLVKDDPQDVLMALKQINTSAAGATWKDRVKTWLSSKGLTKKEAAELENCLVQGPTKTSSCPTIPVKPPETG